MRQIALAFALLSAACGQTKPPAACAQAISTSSVASSALPAARIVGGFLTIRRWKDSDRALEGRPATAADLDVFRCAVAVRFTESKSFAMRLITAGHCIPHDTTESITLEIGADGGYESIPIKAATLDLARRLRNASGFDASERRELGTILKKLVAQSNTGESDAQKNERIITNTSDLEVLGATVDGDVSLPAVNLLNKLRLMDLASSQQSSLAGSEKEKARAWEAHVFGFDAVKHGRMVALFAKRLEKCASGDKGICRSPDRVRAVLTQQLPPDLGRIISDKSARAGAEARYDEGKKERDRLWAALRPLLQKSPSRLHIHSNFSVRASQAGVDTTRTTGDDDSTRYAVASLESVAGKGVVGEVTDQGMIFKQSAASTLRFQHGDSGSLFSIGGSVPIAVISAVDFGYSSGGASVIALPPRRQTAAAAPQSKTATTNSNKTEATPSRVGGASPAASQSRENPPALPAPTESVNDRSTSYASARSSQTDFIETTVPPETTPALPGSVPVQEGNAERNAEPIDSAQGKCT